MKGGPENAALEAQFKLACAWQARGNRVAAETGFKRIISQAPAYAPAHSRLGELMLENGQLATALQHFNRALELQPDNADLRFRHHYVQDLLFQARPAEHSVPGLQDQPGGKIDLYQQKYFRCHRSGWNYVLQALQEVHHSQGARFDGFIENNFAWKHWRSGRRDENTLQRLRDSGSFGQLSTSEEQGITPYTTPWVGCVHNPQNMPYWFHYEEAPQSIFRKAIWQESLEHCQGLFTFSDYHAIWLREQTGKPVSVLTHPTEIPERQFKLDRFLANPQKKIVQIGWWLRRLSAIYELPLARNNPLDYQKIRLVPLFFDNADVYLEKLIEKELDLLEVSLPQAFKENTREEMHLSNSEYDELLCSNLAFVCLYDANANNAVIECIARATPLLVNPLPAVVEYLGEAYPLYFNDLDEAAEKALDLDLIERAHDYLKVCPTRARLDRDYFLRTFKNSEVYRSL